MSFSNVESRIFDPVFDKSGRAEFRLPSETAFLSDLRLIDIGISSTSATDSPNPLLGIMAGIRRIQLLDGSTLLDQINVATIYNAFRNANQVNDSNLSMNTYGISGELDYKGKDISIVDVFEGIGALEF